MISLPFSTPLPRPSPRLNLLSSRKFRLDGELSLAPATPTPVLTRLGPLFLRPEVSRFFNSAVPRMAVALSLPLNVLKLASSTLLHELDETVSRYFFVSLSRIETDPSLRRSSLLPLYPFWLTRSSSLSTLTLFLHLLLLLATVSSVLSHPDYLVLIRIFCNRILSLSLSFSCPVNE